MPSSEPGFHSGDLDDLYENAPCGYAVLQSDGKIARVNATLCSWLGAPAHELLGSRFRDRLTMPGRVLYETHLIPLLRMQGFVTEIVLDLVTANGKFPVFVSANEKRDAQENLEFTRLIVFQAEQRRTFEQSLVRSRDDAFQGLADEKATGALREQFIAVLGHDLRNPLASIDAGLRMASREPLSPKQSRLVGLMQASSLRMSGLIDNVLDFARGQLGGGLTLSRDASKPLEPTLRQIVNELRTSHADVEIVEAISIEVPVDCDHSRVGQLLSNLLGNALTHGAIGQPVRVEVSANANGLELSVANAGDPIPTAAMEHLFQPFFRGDVRQSANGLGLGLHIASEIAKAHGGTLTVSSTPDETRFTFRMPLVAWPEAAHPLP
ncbi:PAS domain-containing sensor histidine kinase [Bosea sp. Root381]|nr:PAS domain-containing sensor histidine kinase [Bosea sp. Root381]